MSQKSRRQSFLTTASLVLLRVGRRRHDEPPPLFVVGSGRSGNTLVRRVLMASEAIYIPPETYVLGEIIESWPRTCLLPWRERVWLFCAYFEKHPEFSTFGMPNLDAFIARVSDMPRSKQSLTALIDAFYRWLAELHGSPASRWGDKTPYNTVHLRSIGALYPDAKYLWLVRDGRDVALSYVEAGLYPDVPEAAERWCAANRACMDFAATGRDVLRLSYEALVADPERFFATVYEWAGLDFSPEYLTRMPGKMGDVENRGHHERVRTPISAASAGRWRDRMSPEDLRALSPAFWEVMRTLGYGTGTATVATACTAADDIVGTVEDMADQPRRLGSP